MLNIFHPIREITYTVPLQPPLETDAFIAPAKGDWRLFVFPGTPCNKLLYTRFLKTAPRGMEVVVVSRPGFGKGHKDAFTDFNDQIAAIKPFLPGGAWGDKKIITMGVSYGGELALKAALEFPNDVYGVVTVSALIDEPYDYALQLEKFGAAPGVAELTPNRWRKVRAEVAGRRAQIGPLLRDLATLKAPVEVLHGDFDAMVSKSNADTLMRALEPTGNAALEIFPGGTHYLEFQYPRRIYRAIQRVIARSGAG